MSTNRASSARVWLEIGLDILRRNYANIAGAVSPCGVVAVLKADAYGLGAVPIAAALKDAGCGGFGVAELNEALALTKFGLPVQILGSVLAEEVPEAVRAGLVLPVTDLETAQCISRESRQQGRTTLCHCLVDTGMGRLGILAREAVRTITGIATLPNLDCEGIYSHFPMAYRSGSEYTGRQIDLFLGLLEELRVTGIEFRKVHIANSDAVNNFPRTCRPPFNVVRTGINLHGSFDIEGLRSLDLRPVLTLKTRLTAVRSLPEGSAIGYGCTYRMPRRTRIGTVSAGYADGLPLALSNRGYVLIRGRPCPVLGRVSMDYTTVSLDEVPDAECGDEVICLGGEGPMSISVDNWAQLKGTHSYEIICSFGTRVERRYLDQ